MKTIITDISIHVSWNDEKYRIVYAFLYNEQCEINLVKVKRLLTGVVHVEVARY